MEISIVKAIQSLACGFLDAFFWIVTKIGEEKVFLLILIGIYLLYSKKFAIKYSFFYLVSVGINSLVKIMIKRPRPYIASDEISNRLPASGYSFPSGHSQGYFVQASSGMLEINEQLKSRKIKISMLISFIIVGVLVMLSRLYWGQHYLTDVITGAMFGVTIAMLLDFIFRYTSLKIKEKFTLDNIYKRLLILTFALFIIFISLDLAFEFYSRKVYSFLGVFMAMGIGYFIDKNYINYKEKSSTKITIIKFSITYVVIIALYLLVTHLIDLKRYLYFIVYLFLGLICTIILPLIFSKIFKEKDCLDGNSDCI